MISVLQFPPRSSGSAPWLWIGLVGVASILLSRAFACAMPFAALATFAAFGYARARQLFALAVWAMFAVTLWLLFVQAFMLHAFCRYCLFSAALVFVLAAMVVLTPSSR